MKDDNKIDPEIKAKGAKTWMPVIVLTFAAFVFNTSEFVPIGLLSDIANDFGITEANAGMLITVYAWVVAIASLPLMLVFAKTENKKLLMSITALFIASHIFSGLSGDFCRHSKQGSIRQSRALFPYIAQQICFFYNFA